ncbi:MAG: hypothetical protein AAF630_08070 [Cyanobacteria bacterium P01_C01_bin.38]
MISVELSAIASEAKQSQQLGLLRFARNDILIYRRLYELLRRLVEKVEKL